VIVTIPTRLLCQSCKRI